MAGPDANAIAALRAPYVHPVYVAFLDIVGDPIRVTTAPFQLTFSGTGDVDLDGQTFSAVEADFLSVSQITMKEGGSDAVSVSLSGMIGVDSGLLNQIGNRNNWQGRFARLWRLQLSEDLQQIGSVWPFFTGYMTTPTISGSRKEQVIRLEIENYLAFLTAPSNRSYLNQRDYDPDDHSADATIAAANGQSAAGNTIAMGGGGNAVARQADFNGNQAL